MLSLGAAQSTNAQTIECTSRPKNPWTANLLSAHESQGTGYLDTHDKQKGVSYSELRLGIMHFNNEEIKEVGSNVPRWFSICLKGASHSWSGLCLINTTANRLSGFSHGSCSVCYFDLWDAKVTSSADIRLDTLFTEILTRFYLVNSIVYKPWSS